MRLQRAVLPCTYWGSADPRPIRPTVQYVPSSTVQLFSIPLFFFVAAGHQPALGGSTKIKKKKMEGELDESFIPCSSISAAIVISRKTNLLLSNGSISNDRSSHSNSSVIQICVVARIPNKLEQEELVLSDEERRAVVRSFTMQCFIFLDDSRRLNHLDSLLTRFANHLSRVVLASTESSEVTPVLVVQFVVWFSSQLVLICPFLSCPYWNASHILPGESQ